MRALVAPVLLQILWYWRVLALGRSRGLFLVNRVDYRHAITDRHITSTRRADGVGLYGDASDSCADASADTKL